MSAIAKIKGIIAVILGATSFGVLSTIVKKAYAQGFSLGEVTGIQALIGVVVLWAILALIAIIAPSYFRRYRSQSAKWDILLSGITTGAVSMLYYKSVQLIPASLAIVMLMQYIWIGQLVEFIFFRTKASWPQILGILLILTSTLLATGVFEKDLADISPMGIVYGLLAATAYALFIIVNGRVGNDYPPLHKSALMISGACIFIFILLWPFSIFEADIWRPLWMYGVLLAIFGTVLPPLLFAYGMPRTGFSLGSILSVVELPVAVGMSYIVLQEDVSSLQAIGVVCILAVVIFVNIKKKKKA